MEQVAENLHKILDKLPAGVRLVAVSKFHPKEYIEQAYNEGQRIFGESHEQELAKKASSLPKDIEWHFIGHLQTNKVKYIASYISMIEAVDSFKLLKEINKQAEKKKSRTLFLKLILIYTLILKRIKQSLKPNLQAITQLEMSII